VTTPSGGCHVYVRHPGHVVPTITSHSNAHLREHFGSLDVKGDGGYAVALAEGYSWAGDFAPEPWEVVPAELRRYLADRAEGRHEPAQAAERIGAGRVADDEALARRLARAATSKATRHAGLLAAGHALVDREREELPEMAERVRGAVNALRPDKPPIEADEALRIIRDGHAFAREHDLAASQDGHAVVREREPLRLDFEEEPEPPDYLVAGLVERGSLVVLSGDTGAGKSIVSSALVMSVLRGEEWLGREVERGRAVVIDEENPAARVRRRLGSLGLTNADREQLAYYCRAGVLLGTDDEDAWLRSVVEHCRPGDLLVIDAATSAAGVDINDNAEVARLMSRLRRIAEATGVTIVLLHHERKRQPGAPRDAGQSMMGARQWAGQADVHLAFAVAGPYVESEPDSTGRRTISRAFTMRAPKLRDGGIDEARTIVVSSTRRPRAHALDGRPRRGLVGLRLPARDRARSPARRARGRGRRGRVGQARHARRSEARRPRLQRGAQACAGPRVARGRREARRLRPRRRPQAGARGGAR